MNAEEIRLQEERDKKKHWRRWGSYVSERQWGSVREDYSAAGDAWNYFPHDHARSRAYRWGEDGIAGISDNHMRLCFAPAFWNEEDPILKERYFGLTGTEGNHGEDVKECYYYLDNTPTHSYMKALYKYPHHRFPYETLVEENRRRGLNEKEFELADTGIFNENRYFEITIEYAKAEADDILIRITLLNRGAQSRRLHVLPTIWFRNTWSWAWNQHKPLLKAGAGFIEAHHLTLGLYKLYFEESPELLFTENETNHKKLFKNENQSAYVKDAFHDYLIEGKKQAVNPALTGTKAAPHYALTLAPGAEKVLRLRLSNRSLAQPMQDFEAVFNQRIAEADVFYQSIIPGNLGEDHHLIARQAFAGLLWSKQFYNYVVESWIKGDPAAPPPPEARQTGRNSSWGHFYSEDILSMPDKWEYPWFASWDLAFHCISLVLVDPDFAKKQLELLTREWYMHPNGQLPAYEWSFDDVNPPVHAWAAWRIYKIEKKRTGKGDRDFLERVFQKLLLNFTWWVNRKDASGKNIFQGGFMGLDNISPFNRSEPVKEGVRLDQCDATSWMAMYCLNMLTLAFELAKENPVYEDIASKFYEHFLYIAEAISQMGTRSTPLWNEEDGFFYDVLHQPGAKPFPIKVRSMVGLIPIFAVETITSEFLNRFPGFKKRFEWFLEYRGDLCGKVASMMTPGVSERRLLAILKPENLRRILQKMLDENEFLSPYGIRSVSRYHQDHPYSIHWDGTEKTVRYDPADSTSKIFGGNSNWRGPVWFPLNYLLIESLQKFHHYLGDSFKVECPTGSGKWLTLWDVSLEITRRMMNIFLKTREGRRPVFGKSLCQDPAWQNHILFYEFFNGDSGEGLGASHQTGWTALIAKLIQQYGEYSAHEIKPASPEIR